MCSVTWAFFRKEKLTCSNVAFLQRIRRDLLSIRLLIPQIENRIHTCPNTAPFETMCALSQAGIYIGNFPTSPRKVCSGFKHAWKWVTQAGFVEGDRDVVKFHRNMASSIGFFRLNREISIAKPTYRTPFRSSNGFARKKRSMYPARPYRIEPFLAAARGRVN